MLLKMTLYRHKLSHFIYFFEFIALVSKFNWQAEY